MAEFRDERIPRFLPPWPSDALRLDFACAKHSRGPALRSFPPPSLRPLLRGAQTTILTACKKLGLPRFLHHSMRHYFCSNAIEAGIDFNVIASWLGHKDGGVLVAKTYGHLRDTHSFEMAKRMTFSAVPAVAHA